MSSTTTETTPRTDWYKVSNVDDVASPALLVYPDRVTQNVRKTANMLLSILHLYGIERESIGVSHQPLPGLA